MDRGLRLALVLYEYFNFSRLLVHIFLEHSCKHLLVKALAPAIILVPLARPFLVTLLLCLQQGLSNVVVECIVCHHRGIIKFFEVLVGELVGGHGL